MSCNITNLTTSNGYCGVFAGTTPVYTGQLVQPVGETFTSIGSGALTTLTLTLIDTVSNGIVNSVDNINILNTGRGTVDANGNIVISFLSGDTALYNLNSTIEERSILINFSFNGGSRVGAKEVIFTIIGQP